MSFLAPRLARQVCLNAASQYRVRAVVVARRTIHVTASVSAKKKKKNQAVYEGFDEGDEEDGFFDPADLNAEASSSTTSSAAEAEQPSAAPVAIKKPLKTNRAFKRHYAYLDSTLSRQSTVQERASIKPQVFRQLIMNARSEEDWKLAREIVDRWQKMLDRNDHMTEKLLMHWWWVLRRMRPREMLERQYEAENMTDAERAAAAGAIDAHEVKLESVIPEHLTEKYERFNDTMIEDLSTQTGRDRLLFNSYYDQLMSRVHTKSILFAPESSLVHLVKLAKHRPDLERVAEVMKRWREYMGRPDKEVDELFLARCMNLREPAYAVQILADRAIYGIDVHSLKQVHALFHSLMLSTADNPDECVAAAFRLAEIVSGLPWRHVMQDPISPLMIIWICHLARKGPIGKTSREKGAQVFDELQAFLEIRKKGMSDQQRDAFRQLGFVKRPRGLHLSEKEKRWRKEAVEVAQKFGKSLKLDISWLNLPEASDPAAESASA